MAWRAISINKSIYNRPLDASAEMENKGKMNIALYLPPSDIPQFIYHSVRGNEDVFIINFKYSNAEKEKELFSKNNLRLIIGAYSGKPLRIEIKNVKKDNITTIQLTRIIGEGISGLIEESVKKIEDIRKATNLKRATEMLRQNAEALATVPA